MRRRALGLLLGAFLLTACGPRLLPTGTGLGLASSTPTYSALVTSAPRETLFTDPPATGAVTLTSTAAPSAPPRTPTRTVVPSSTPSPYQTPTSTAPPTAAPTSTVAPDTPTSSPAPAPTRVEDETRLAQEQRPEGVLRIAVIGDYGLATPGEEDVAVLVKGWRPDLIITTGDNNYPVGSPETIDLNIGQFYHDFIAPYAGQYGAGATENRFFPALGNHDWMNPGAQAYLDYFTLPGNERYYDVARGPVHLFVLDSMPGEPDGIDSSSRQAAWLREELAAATEPWKLVTMHHPPFSSGPHGSTPVLRWPFGEWGATAVLAGHDHIYERIERDGIVYFVNGLGGSVRYAVGQPVEGSRVRFNDDFGALRIDADQQEVTFRFITRGGKQVDEYTITR